LSFIKLFYLNIIRRIKIVSLLNYIDYNNENAVKILEDELGWKYYGGKHYESIYTRFYQGYILPNKFSIDKRYGHYSDLINAGQISRDEAIEKLKSPPYPDDLQEQDFKYVLRKLNLSLEQFNIIMALPNKSFKDYKNSYNFVQFLRNTVNSLRRFGLYPK
jgi:hypothetical protein